MKAHVLMLFVFLLICLPGSAGAADISIQSGLNTNWWDSDADDRGSQTYVPVTIDGGYQNMSVKVLTAFAHTDGEASGDRDQSLSSVIDTKVNLSYALLEKLPVDILFGVDVNLPTGKTKLDFTELQLLRNPDLVTINRYGEGFNVNPTVTVAKQQDRWAIGFGVGFLWRGEYDFSEDILDYDPGDIFNLTAEAVYAFTDRWQGRLFGEFALYGTDELDVQDYYREGDYLMAGVGADYIEKLWEASFSVKGIFRGKSEFQEADLALATEDQNSYGDEYHVDLSWLYRLNAQTVISSNLRYLYLSENDYESTSPLYFGSKQKISLGAALQRQFSPDLTGKFGLDGYLLDEERNWYHTDDRLYRGFLVDFSITKAF
jgi:hypothetical protein